MNQTNTVTCPGGPRHITPLRLPDDLHGHHILTHCTQLLYYSTIYIVIEIKFYSILFESPFEHVQMESKILKSSLIHVSHSAVLAFILRLCISVVSGCEHAIRGFAKFKKIQKIL